MLLQDPPKSFLNHLLELRQRLLIYFLSLILTTGFCTFFYSEILTILLHPLNQKLIYTSPAGGLDFIIKISVFGGFIISLPVFLFQTLQFVEPVLLRNIKKQIGGFIIISFLLLGLGLGFGYFVSLPSALYFLGNFGSDQIQAMITANEYFSFITQYLLVFAIFFQLPLIIYILNKFYLLKTELLLKPQKLILVISFIIAAIFTPTPDFVNQVIMAFPLIILYYLSIFIVWINNKFVDSSIH